MTDPNGENNASKTDNNSRLPSKPDIQTPSMPPVRYRLNRFFQKLFGRKPAYLIKGHGVEVYYFDFSDTDTLPFDLETYNDTQIFIGNWANPWYVDIESIKDAYPDFTEENITKIQDVFSERHVYPSQRWKLLANQNALRDMFVGGAIDDQRIMRLLYATLAVSGLAALLLLFGGA